MPGFRVALKLLRCGATVIGTTRFPLDACARFSSESDAPSWMSRLSIVGLDARDTCAVERFADLVNATHARVDILINNAAQVR